MRNFKVGDRVVVSKSRLESVVNKIGTIVSIDDDGDELVKLDDDSDTFSYCVFNDYESDKKDLINIESAVGDVIEHLK